jgi:peptide/nickel transport system substrate-binding protein
MLPSSTQNETAWNDRRLETLYRQAVGDPDEARRAQAVHELQRLQYEEGGYVVWGMADGVDIARANVRGLPQVGGYGRMFLEKTWISA